MRLIWEFAKGLRPEVVPIQLILRVLLQLNFSTTQVKGKAKGRTLTSAEIAERKSMAERRKKRCITSSPVAPVVEHKTHDFIHVVPSTATH